MCLLNKPVNIVLLFSNYLKSTLILNLVFLFCFVEIYLQIVISNSFTKLFELRFQISLNITPTST